MKTTDTDKNYPSFLHDLLVGLVVLSFYIVAVILTYCFMPEKDHPLTCPEYQQLLDINPGLALGPMDSPCD